MERKEGELEINQNDINNLKKLIRLIKKYRDEKIFDHLNIPASFIPIAGPITNIIHGARRKKKSEIILGSAFLALDICTLGTASFLKATVTSTEKIAITTASHTGDIARGIRQGAKGLKWLPEAARISKEAKIAAETAKGALQTGKVVGIGIKTGTTVVGSSNALRLGIKKFNKEEIEIIKLMDSVKILIGENLYNILNEKIIKYINNPICSPKLNKLISKLEKSL